MRKNNTRENNLIRSKVRKMINDKFRVRLIHGVNFKQKVNPLRKVR